MKKDLIKKNYKKKINKINYYNQKYYNDNISEISDANFDELKREVIQLEKKYEYLKSTKSPQLQVGFRPSKNFKKISHKVPMLSLSNAFSEEDLKNFEKKISSRLLFLLMSTLRAVLKVQIIAWHTSQLSTHG